MPIGNNCPRTNERQLEEIQVAARAATSVVRIFVESPARLLVLESTSNLLRSITWTTDLQPSLAAAGCSWRAVELSAQQVGVSSTKKRTYIAGARYVPDAEERLVRWEARLNKAKAQSERLRELIGREGSYVLSRGRG